MARKATTRSRIKRSNRDAGAKPCITGTFTGDRRGRRNAGGAEAHRPTGSGRRRDDKAPAMKEEIPARAVRVVAFSILAFHGLARAAGGHAQ